MPTGIIEEPLYKSQIDQLRIDWKSLDAAFLSLESAVLRIPESFPLIEGTRLRRIQIVGFADVPPISIFFAVNSPNVHLVAAELIVSHD
ncbi:MAG: hypothetical protein ACLPXT_03530 [Terracidiphilus sp.]